MNVDGGELLARTLCSFEVENIFTLHGGHLDSAYRALAGHGVRLLDTRHEQAAGHAAIGYARVSGKTGVCMVTAGGGVSNCVTAIASAYADCIPTVFIAGAPPLRDYDALGCNGGYDQMSLMGGITLWAHRVTHVDDIPYAIGKALRIAGEGRCGPVYIELPSDVLFDLADESLVPFPNSAARTAPPAPAPEAIAEIIDALRDAKWPVIFAGGGVVASGASQLLTQFAELTGVPVLTNTKAKGVISSDHELYGRGFASLAAVVARGGAEADLVIMLGARKGIYTGGSRASFIPAAATLIQVDVDVSEFSRMRFPDLGVVSDCATALTSLIDVAGEYSWSRRTEWIEALCTRTRPAPVPKRGQPTPGDIGRRIADLVPQNAILVADGGETVSWIDSAARISGDRQWLAHGYMGIVGEGLGLAVGAQIAAPEKRVVLYAGDGAIGFNFAEFDTMVRHNLPVIVVVNTDRQWGMSAHGQELLFGKGNRYVTDLAPSRYDIAASGFGAHPELVEDLSEFDAAWARAIKSGKPACINVMTKRTVAQHTKNLIGWAAEGMLTSDGKVRVPYADNLEV